MKRKTTIGAAGLMVFTLVQAGTGASAQSGAKDAEAACPMHARHAREKPDEAHYHAVNARGDEAMGFGHARTTHHFRLAPDGGAIEVSANDGADLATRDRIREHLGTIAKEFSEGRFDIPKAVHDRVPPGVSTMQRLKSEISYTYEATDRGGRVRIATKNPGALAAIYGFLRFQIEDHRTGDSLDVSPTR
jgi:hypothetical protein